MPASLNVLPVLHHNFLEGIKNKRSTVQSEVKDTYDLLLVAGMDCMSKQRGEMLL